MEEDDLNIKNEQQMSYQNKIIIKDLKDQDFIWMKMRGHFSNQFVGMNYEFNDIDGIQLQEELNQTEEFLDKVQEIENALKELSNSFDFQVCLKNVQKPIWEEFFLNDYANFKKKMFKQENINDFEIYDEEKISDVVKKFEDHFKFNKPKHFFDQLKQRYQNFIILLAKSEDFNKIKTELKTYLQKTEESITVDKTNIQLQMKKLKYNAVPFNHYQDICRQQIFQNNASQETPESDTRYLIHNIQLKPRQITWLLNCYQKIIKAHNDQTQYRELEFKSKFLKINNKGSLSIYVAEDERAQIIGNKQGSLELLYNFIQDIEQKIEKIQFKQVIQEINTFFMSEFLEDLWTKEPDMRYILENLVQYKDILQIAETFQNEQNISLVKDYWDQKKNYAKFHSIYLKLQKTDFEKEKKHLNFYYQNYKKSELWKLGEMLISYNTLNYQQTVELIDKLQNTLIQNGVYIFLSYNVTINNYNNNNNNNKNFRLTVFFFIKKKAYHQYKQQEINTLFQECKEQLNNLFSFNKYQIPITCADFFLIFKNQKNIFLQQLEEKQQQMKDVWQSYQYADRKKEKSFSFFLEIECLQNKKQEIEKFVKELVKDNSSHKIYIYFPKNMIYFYFLDSQSMKDNIQEFLENEIQRLIKIEKMGIFLDRCYVENQKSLENTLKQINKSDLGQQDKLNDLSKIINQQLKGQNQSNIQANNSNNNLSSFINSFQQSQMDLKENVKIVVEISLINQKNFLNYNQQQQQQNSQKNKQSQQQQNISSNLNNISSQNGSYSKNAVSLQTNQEIEQFQEQKQEQIVNQIESEVKKYLNERLIAIQVNFIGEAKQIKDAMTSKALSFKQCSDNYKIKVNLLNTSTKNVLQYCFMGLRDNVWAAVNKFNLVIKNEFQIELIQYYQVSNKMQKQIYEKNIQQQIYKNVIDRSFEILENNEQFFKIHNVLPSIQRQFDNKQEYYYAYKENIYFESIQNYRKFFKENQQVAGNISVTQNQLDYIKSKLQFELEEKYSVLLEYQEGPMVAILAIDTVEFQMASEIIKSFIV